MIRYYVSSAGWLCIEVKGQRIPIVQLTEEQLKDVRLVENDLLN